MRNITSIRSVVDRYFRPRSLKSRITLLTLAMVVISIWSLALYAGRMLREDMQQQLGAQQFATVSLVASGINEQMEARLGALKTVAANVGPGMLAHPLALQAHMVQRPLLQNLFNGGTFVTRADGTAIASLPLSAERLGVNYMDRDFIVATLKDGRSAIGQPVMGKKLLAPIFVMSVPLVDAQGKVIGALAGVTNLGTSNFLDKIAAGHYGTTGGYLLIAPQHKLFVTATDKSRIMQALPAAGLNPMHDKYMQGYEGYGIATSSRGVEEVSAAKNIPAAGWFLAAVLPTDEAFAPIHALQRHMLTAMIFLTLLAGGLIWWATSRILRRQLSPMLVAAQVLNTRADTAQSSQPLPVTSQDEIGELIGGFNRLLATLGQREDALRESEALFRAVSESAHDAIVTADSSGKIIKWNSGAGQMFGYSESEAIGQSLTFLMPDRFRERHAAGMSRVSAGGEPHVMGKPVELVGLRKDGSEFPLDLSLAQWRIAEGHFFTGVIRDITARKKTEDALENARTFNLAIFDAVAAEVVAIDHAGVILAVNKRWQKFAAENCIEFGKAVAHTGVGANYLAVCQASSGHDSDAALEAHHGIQAVLDGRLPAFSLDYPCHSPQQQRWYTMVATPLRAGTQGGAVIAHIDITEKKHLAIELDQHRQHLEELVMQRTIELSQALEAAKVADQTKDAFLANMSHELRTPLSAVIGMANLARGISTEPRLRDYLEKISRSGQHLNRIINELLDLSKIAAGHMELEFITFSLHTVTAHAESVMSHRAAEKGLQLATLIDDAVPDVLLGDPTRVIQIFLNLIGNAIKFTQDGRVMVRVGLQARVDNRVCLEIDFEDTGIGMRPEDLKLLFKPFSQADATVTRRFGGTGLGLTISRHLAQMMDGDISVSSVEGSGTTFKVNLWLGLGNAADLAITGAAADDALPKYYQHAHILVADDQPLNREIVEELLAAVGITPRLAENGQQALDILIESGPDAFDLVLMDIQMPIMDGLTATRALRGRAGFEKLPIIAMTAHTMAHEKEINAAAGMNDHIGKPFDNAGFYRTLAKWIPQAKQKAGLAPHPPPGLPLERGGDDVSCGHANTLADPGGLLADVGNELGSLRGVDVAAALARFRGNETSYRRWLSEFAATAGDVPGQMRSEIAAGQLEKAGKLAHTFKGRVGMLGMNDLYGMVAALELVLRDGTPADELLGGAERAIGEMCSELDRVLNPGAAESATAKEVLESVAWNDTYSVGVPALDDQHKKLVSMINQLADCHAARNCGSSGAFHEVLSRMFDYSQVHFKAEEDYLRRIGYPQLADQKIEHAAFVGKMAAFSMAAAEGVPDEVAVHRYLKAWLLSHILESDMQYRSFAESKL